MFCIGWMHSSLVFSVVLPLHLCAKEEVSKHVHVHLHIFKPFHDPLIPAIAVKNVDIQQKSIWNIHLEYLEYSFHLEYSFLILRYIQLFNLFLYICIYFMQLCIKKYFWFVIFLKT